MGGRVRRRGCFDPDQFRAGGSEGSRGQGGEGAGRCGQGAEAVMVFGRHASPHSYIEFEGARHSSSTCEAFCCFQEDARSINLNYSHV